MRIESVKAHPFGPFANQELHFGAGLTVVSGGNETGKSSWHAAASTALSGRRKGRSRKIDLDLSPHQPWDRDDWAVSCVVALDDGRRIRLVHNLAAGRSQALDDITGADLTAELMADGGVDASTLVGLNRLTLPLVSSVRQADILALSAAAAADADVAALRGLLQQAVSSRVDTDSTAEQAIARLEQFNRVTVGTERKGSGKPLRVALDALHQAEQRRDQAHAAWAAQRAAEHDHADVAARVQKLQDRLDTLGTADLVARAQRLIGRVSRAEELMAAAEAGPSTDVDADLVERAQSVLADHARLETAPARPRRTGAVVQAQLDAVPKAPAGPMIPSPETERAAARLDAAATALTTHHAASVPANASTITHQWSPAELRSAAAAVANPPAPASLPVPASTPWSAASVLSLAVGICLLLTGLVVSSVPVLVAGAAVLSLGLGLRVTANQTPVPVVAPSETSHDRLVIALTADGLTVAPDALEAEAQAVEAQTAAQDARSTWERQDADLTNQTLEAEKALRSQLQLVGVTAERDGSGPLVAAMELYRTECAARAQDHARQSERIELERELEQIEQVENQRRATLDRHAAWRDRARAVTGEIGLDVGPLDTDVDPAILHSWIAMQRGQAAERGQAREAAAALAEMLQDGSVEDLRYQATAARQTALESGASADVFDSGRTVARPDRARLTQLRHDLGAAQQRQAEVAGALAEASRSLQGLAEVNEQCNRAQADYDRLRRLGWLVNTTREHLTAARREVHRDIAPLIVRATNDRLARVSAGRYKQIRVNPEDLSVQVELADGSWRSAEALSHGTTEQIYLLARIAIAETVAATESCPLLLDDVTVHADADRTEALLDLLLELSADRQIVLFSQEDAVRSWALTSGATTIELEAI